MSVNSAQSLIGMLAVVLWLSSCATSRRRAYDMRPENRAALYQERKASPYYRMDNEHTFPIYKAPYTVNQQEGQVLFGRGLMSFTVRRTRLMSRLRTVAQRTGGFLILIQDGPLSTTREATVTCCAKWSIILRIHVFG